jgi:hypothetical protein
MRVCADQETIERCVQTRFAVVTFVTPKEMAPTEQVAEAIRGTMRDPGMVPEGESKVLMVRSLCLQFMGDLLPSNDSDLMW